MAPGLPAGSRHSAPAPDTTGSFQVRHEAQTLNASCRLNPRSIFHKGVNSNYGASLHIHSDSM